MEDAESNVALLYGETKGTKTRLAAEFTLFGNTTLLQNHFKKLYDLVKKYKTGNVTGVRKLGWGMVLQNYASLVCNTSLVECLKTNGNGGQTLQRYNSKKKE